MRTCTPPLCAPRFPTWAFLAACFWLVAPRAALADPFVVTSGSIALFGPGATFQNGSLSFQGPGLDAGVVAAWFPAGPVFSFFADDTVDMSTTVTPGGWGVATVGSSSFGEVNFGGSLRF